MAAVAAVVSEINPTHRHITSEVRGAAVLASTRPVAARSAAWQLAPQRKHVAGIRERGRTMPAPRSKGKSASGCGGIAVLGSRLDCGAGAAVAASVAPLAVPPVARRASECHSPHLGFLARARRSAITRVRAHAQVWKSMWRAPVSSGAVCDSILVGVHSDPFWTLLSPRPR